MLYVSISKYEKNAMVYSSGYIDVKDVLYMSSEKSVVSSNDPSLTGTIYELSSNNYSGGISYYITKHEYKEAFDTITSTFYQVSDDKYVNPSFCTDIAINYAKSRSFRIQVLSHGMNGAMWNLGYEIDYDKYPSSWLAVSKKVKGIHTDILSN